MSVSFARPDISQMVFRVYGRSIHPELMRVYAETRAWQDAYSATIRICEAGHSVEVRFGNEVITEITSTKMQPLPQQKRLLERRLSGQHDDAITFSGGVRYQVSYQLEQLDHEVFMNFNEELVLDCSKAARELQWHPVWGAETTIARTARWYRDFLATGTVASHGDLARYVEDAHGQGHRWAA